MKNSFIKSIVYILFITSNIFGQTLYEDAEDGNVNGWRVYDNSPSGASIHNVMDGDNRVIEFRGSGSDNGYILGGWENDSSAWQNTDEHIISWKMKYNEGYVVYIRVTTTAGSKYIYYSSASSDNGGTGKYIHHGLGSNTRDGQWHTITRDLSVDLHDFVPDADIIEVNAFLIRGSGFVDDIRLYSDNPSIDTTKPIITLNGGDVILTVGDSYTDKGASAIDNVDGDITANIATTSNVDTATAGTYTITYNVKDASGNVAETVVRRVIVNGSNQSETSTLYEDAEDGNVNGWRVYDNSPSGASIHNVMDGDNRVIEFRGSGSDNGYILGGWENDSSAWQNTDEHIISWKMKYNEEYTIYIRIMTTTGAYYLQYQARDINEGLNGEYIKYGLGSSSIDGQWQTFTRNLRNDLHDILPNSEFISVNGFLIRGNGQVDNIKLNTNYNIPDITAPVITVNETSITHTLGDIYIDNGVSAIDDRDGDVTTNIVTTGSVDIAREGVYTLRYNVRDSAGNAAIEMTRSVYVKIDGISLSVSANTLKTSFLPKEGLNGTLTYTIDASSTQGNVTLLDSHTGRYSYLSTLNNDYDSFFFTITDTNGNSITKRVNIYLENIPVTVNIETNTETDNFSSNLPIVIIDTGDKTIPNEPKIKGSMSIILPTDNNRSHLGLPSSYKGHIEIEIRGSSSQSFPKKQYSFDTETWDRQDDDVSLIGMPSEHKWILSAPYSDKSLMRNYLAYNETRKIDESKYNAVRTKYVEVLTRIDNHYRYDGVYILMEKVKRDKNRVDIKKMKSSYDSLPKLSGGYIFKRDRGTAGMLGIDGTKYVFVYPKETAVTGEQSNYMETYLQNFETALEADDFGDANSVNYYGNYIDVDSFITHMLSREFFKDVDSWGLSEYLHKEREDKLFMSTVWDFNLGMGNNNYGFPRDSTSLWAYNRSSHGLYHWMARLMSDSAFHNQVKQKWQTLRNGVWSDANLATFIDNTRLLLDEAATRNFERWTNVLGKYVWPNQKRCTKNSENIYCDTFDVAVNEGLKPWVINRAHWIDGELQ